MSRENFPKKLATIRARIHHFISAKKLSVAEFERTVDLSNGFVNNLGDGIRKISLEKIKKVFPDLNTSWVLTGDGDMLINKEEVNNNIINDDGGGLDHGKYSNNQKTTDKEDKYVKLLEETNAFYKRMMETNLRVLGRNQDMILAHLQAGVKRAAERYVADDPKKTDEEIHRVNTYAAEYLMKSVPADIDAGN